MQPTTFLLLALSALPSTLAFPAPAPTAASTNDTLLLPTLQTRGGNKWAGGDPKIGSFTDTSCTLDSMIPPPPKTKFAGGWGCIKFTPGTDNVGINWGNSRARAVWFYTDDKCKNYATKRLDSFSAGGDNGKGKADKCISYKANGGNWKSVAFWFPDY